MTAYPWADVYAERLQSGVNATPGTITVRSSGNRSVISMFAQMTPGKCTVFSRVYGYAHSETPYSRLAWFKTCLDLIDALALDVVAIPFNIGCGLAGGKWTDYQQLLENATTKFVVYEQPKPKAKKRLRGDPFVPCELIPSFPRMTSMDCRFKQEKMVKPTLYVRAYFDSTINLPIFFAGVITGKIATRHICFNPNNYPAVHMSTFNYASSVTVFKGFIMICGGQTMEESVQILLTLQPFILEAMPPPLEQQLVV